MNEKFSRYLKNIGILNETASSSIMKSDEKSSTKSFNDSTFDLLMNYFNNLDEEQKKFMSQNIPSNFIINSEQIQKNILRSIIIQLNLRKKIILLKSFFHWRLHSYMNNNNKNITEDNNNGTKLKLVNIDNNEEHNFKDVINDKNDNLNNNNINGEEPKSKDNQSNRNTSNNEYFFKHLPNNNYINSENSNYKYINIYQNKNDSDKKSYNFSENIIKSNNKYNIYNQNKTNNSASHRKINQTKSKEINTNVKTNLMTSLEEKEMLELEECYFRPKINKEKPKDRFNSSQNDENNNKKRQEVFEKLYRYSEKYKLAKELRAIELEKIAGQKITFMPKTFSWKKIKENKKSKKPLYQLDINNNKKNVQQSRVKSEGNLNFQKRQENYLIKKRKHSAEIKNQIDSEFNEICSFNPKINSEKSMSNYSTNKKSIKKNKTSTVFCRLYEEGKERIKTKNKKEKNILDKFLEMSNILNPEKTFDFKTINRLYENKKQKYNIKKIIKKVEQEEGTTFKPFLPQNNYSKTVNGTFYERNQKLLHDRENFYDNEKKKIDEYEKKNAVEKEYTKEERQKVINNIINRLYNDSSFIKRSIKGNNCIKK